MAGIAALLVGCAPGLSDPSRFEGDEVCDFDVQEELLIPRCATSGCHGAYQPAAGLEVVTGGLAERLMRTEATTCVGRPLIDRENPSASYLLARVGHAPRCGDAPVDRMPLVGEPLTEREITCLTQWVEAAATAGEPGGAAPRRDAGRMDVDGAVDADEADAGS